MKRMKIVAIKHVSPAQVCLRPAHCPEPRLGSLQRSPDPLAGFKREGGRAEWREEKGKEGKKRGREGKEEDWRERKGERRGRKREDGEEREGLYFARLAKILAGAHAQTHEGGIQGQLVSSLYLKSASKKLLLTTRQYTFNDHVTLTL